MIRLSFFSFLLFGFIACQSTEPKPVEQPVEVKKTDTIPPFQVNDSINRFYAKLGGLNDDFKQDTSNPGIRLFNAQWENMRQKRLEPVSSWTKENLPEDCRHTPFLFYPFSGPDFVISNALFPKMNRMIMFGLEDPGYDISHRGIAYATSVFPRMRMALRDYLGKSYFVTGNMNKDLRSDSIRGVTPFLSTFILRSGYKIISIKNFKLDSTGQKEFDTLRVTIPGAIKGVEIKYTKDLKEQSMLDYLSFNAADAAMQAHPELKTYLTKNIPDQTCTYFKSASYLMHYEMFSYIRDVCLQKSRYVLQDDTGIPYNYFTPNWQMRVWGIYDFPIVDFSSNLYQRDLDSLYKASAPVAPLPFSLGYHYYNNRQNLMLATRR